MARDERVNYCARLVHLVAGEAAYCAVERYRERQLPYLNIIGVTKEKKGGTWDNNGHRIFVKLWGKDTKIWLVNGDSFNVIDSDGTDGSAKLQLLDPYPDSTTDSIYRIYARALGKPGGSANMTSGFVDEHGNE